MSDLCLLLNKKAVCSLRMGSPAAPHQKQRDIVLDTKQIQSVDHMIDTMAVYYFYVLPYIWGLQSGENSFSISTHYGTHLNFSHWIGKTKTISSMFSLQN